MSFSIAQCCRGAFTPRSNLALSIVAISATALAPNSNAVAGIPYLFTLSDNISLGPDLRPYDVAVGDFNRDFLPDLVVAGAGEERGFLLLMGKAGSPAFHPPQVIIIDPNAANAHNGRGVVVDDFNNDGFQDVVLARENSLLTVSPGNGDGSFAPHVEILATVDALDNFLWPMRMTTFELDGDGDRDLMMANSRNGLLYVFRNDGNFAFSLVQTINLQGATQIDADDLDGDELDDLVWTSPGGALIAMNTGNGMFASPSFLELGDPGENDGIYDVEIVDLNLDGARDVLGVFPGSPAGKIGVALNDGAGGFAAVSHHAIPPVAPLDAKLADFDGDQRIDIAVLEATGIVYFLRNETTSPDEFVFDNAYHIESSGFVTLRIAVANMDADCDYDVIVANRNSGNVAVLRNLSEQFNQCTIADFDYDGLVDGDDLTYLLSEWGKAGSPADLDLSGRVEGWDLAFLLWGWQQPVP